MRGKGNRGLTGARAGFSAKKAPDAIVRRFCVLCHAEKWKKM
jgi:hypothetical protein